MLPPEKSLKLHSNSSASSHHVQSNVQAYANEEEEQSSAAIKLEGADELTLAAELSSPQQRPAAAAGFELDFDFDLWPNILQLQSSSSSASSSSSSSSKTRGT